MHLRARAGLLVTAACVLCCGERAGHARASTVRVDDAVLALRLSGPTTGRPSPTCRGVLVVTSDEVPFSLGDRLFLRLEARGRNEPVWSEDGWVADEEVRAGRVERRFDCTEGLAASPSGADVRAAARVEKGACWLGCAYDRPRTAWLPQPRIFADGFEDGAGGAWRWEGQPAPEADR